MGCVREGCVDENTTMVSPLGLFFLSFYLFINIFLIFYYRYDNQRRPRPTRGNTTLLTLPRRRHSKTNSHCGHIDVSQRSRQRVSLHHYHTTWQQTRQGSRRATGGCNRVRDEVQDGSSCIDENATTVSPPWVFFSFFLFIYFLFFIIGMTINDDRATSTTTITHHHQHQHHQHHPHFNQPPSHSTRRNGDGSNSSRDSRRNARL